MYSSPSSHSRYFVITSDYLAPLALILISMVSVYLLFFSPLFAAQVFLCERDSKPCGASPVAAELTRYSGHNLFLLDEAGLQASLTASDPTLSAVQTTKILPHTLRVELTSERAAFALQLVGSDQFVLLDSNLRSLSVASGKPGVPSLLVTSLPPFALGQPIGGEIAPAASLGLQIMASSVSPKSMRYAAGVLEITLESGRIALLSPTGDAARQLSLLQAVLGDRTILEGVATIDVRYAQPILK